MRVTDLVDAQRLVLGQLTRLVEGVGLEEAPDRSGRVEELPVARALLLIGGEHGALGRRLPGLDDVDGALSQSCTGIGRREVLDDEESVAPIPVDVGGAEHEAQCRRRG